MRARIWTASTIGGLSAVLGACADLTTYNSARPLNSQAGGQAFFIDAKQRAIVAVPTTTTTWTYGNDGRPTKAKAENNLRVCAEPSPDALSALATSASGQLSEADKAKVVGAFSAAESAASIGLRTQSIQLMRDADYRLCEAAASGLLSSVQYETLQRRYQSSMVAVLAIEQLTGAVKADQATLGSSASASSDADALVKLTTSLADAKKTLADDQADADKKKAKADADRKAANDFLAGLMPPAKTADDIKAQADKDKYAPLDATAKASEATSAAAADNVKTAQQTVDDVQKLLDAARAGSLNVAATAILGSSKPNTESVTAEVAGAVKDIVTETLDLGFLRETCASLMNAVVDGRSLATGDTTDFRGSCKTYFDNTVAAYKAQVDGQALAVAYVRGQLDAKKPIDPDVLKVLAGLSSGTTPKPAAPAPAPPAALY